MAADIPDLHAVEVNFDGITYAKGASVLKQLVAYVGLDHFLSGLRDYFAAHAFDNATFDDLLSALEKAPTASSSRCGGISSARRSASIRSASEPVPPMDTSEPSSGVELFMLGMLDTDRSMIRAFETGEGIMGSFGHMLDLSGN